jgi:hypothetical protein
MACRAARFHFHKHRIGIAIQADGANLLSISGSLAFMPQRFRLRLQKYVSPFSRVRRRDSSFM